MSGRGSFTEVMARARAGDRAALGELLETYLPHVEASMRRRIFFGRIGGIELGDVMQILTRNFLETANQCDFHDADALIAYLHRAGVNLLLKHTGAQRKRRIFHIGHSEARLGVDMAADFESRELVDLIRRLVSDEEWQLLWLRAEGYPWTHIGEELQLAPNTTRLRFARLKRRLLRDLRRLGW